jgi:geranylgeranyl diphosphate synthase type II
MIELKTSVLIAASLKIGAIIGGASDEDSGQIYEFGRNLGVAFQIQDDLLDIYGDANVFGKIHGGDITANKKTFLYVKAMSLASEEQVEKLQKIYSLSDDDGQKVKRVKELYDQLDIKTVTETLANEYIIRAFSILERISVDKERKKELQNIVSSLIGRNK